MTVKELLQKANLNVFLLSDEDREIGGVYCGDLLSWVMGRAKDSDIWVTIMTNVNVVAVASLIDVSCVILAEDVVPDNDVIEAAKLKGINILGSEKDTYSLCVTLGTLL